MRFKNLISSEEFKHGLTTNIDNGRVPHAQIFEGKAGYQTLAHALAYAQYINCTNPTDGDSCGKCHSCIMSEKLEHPDILFIYPVGVPLGKSGKKEDYVSSDFLPQWRELFLGSSPVGCFSESEWYRASGIGGERGNSQGSIGRSEADTIFDKVSYSPSEAGFRIFIIWLPERMNRQVANSLLKLFEEPPHKCIFLFVSETPSQVLPTIVSRTQSVTIPAITSSEIYKYLISISEKDSDTLKTISGVCGGDVLAAVEMLKGIDKESEELEMFTELTRSCYKGAIEDILEWVEAFVALGKESQKRFFSESVAILRNSFMMSIGAENISYSYGKERDFIMNFHKIINRKNIDVIVSEFERTHKELSQNGNSRIVVTHFALSLITQLKIK